MNNNRKKAKQNKTSRASVASATSQSTRAPKVSSSGNSRRIRHRELVGSILGSVGFEANRYDLNPGISSTFPWLSSQADGWEQYRFHKLCFEYVTRTATSTVGSVILAPDYDPTDSPPSTEAIATSYMDAVENAPWVDQTCLLNSNAMFPMGPRKFVRSSMVAGDPRTYDAGTFYLCTVEEVGANAIGKLWVSYDVELYIPQLAASAPTATSASFFQNTAGVQALATGVAESVEFGDTIVDGLRIGDATVGVYTPPAGSYLIQAELDIDDDTAEQLTVSLFLYKNGAPMTIPVTSREADKEVSAGGSFHMSIQGYLSMNGTDTFAVWVSATGAAGTLTVMGRSARLLVQVI